MPGCDRRWLGVAPLAVCFLCTGCVSRTVHGDQSVYAASWWVIPTAILVGLIAIPFGWLLGRLSERLRFVLGRIVGKVGFYMMFLVPLAALCLADALRTEAVTVTAAGFELVRGLSLDPQRYAVRFADLQAIHGVRTDAPDGRGVAWFVCVSKTGAEVRVPMGDVLPHAVPEIYRRARALGVRVPDTADST